MELLSLFLVIAAGTATLLTNDPRFVLFKPSVIYVIVGVVMLKPGWMNRYLPDTQGQSCRTSPWLWASSGQA
jgi:intracellular septation protein A